MHCCSKGHVAVVIDEYSEGFLVQFNNSITIHLFHFSLVQSVYGMSTLGPSDWDALITRFEQDDDLFDTFYRYVYILVLLMATGVVQFVNAPSLHIKIKILQWKD